MPPAKIDLRLNGAVLGFGSQEIPLQGRNQTNLRIALHGEGSQAVIIFKLPQALLLLGQLAGQQFALVLEELL